MPVNSQHPDYAARLTQWCRCRDAFEGQDAIKAKGRQYLPMLTKQTWTNYNSYKDRALFFSITGKTVSALVGMALLRQPMTKYPAEMSSYFTEHQGIQFWELLSTTIAENLLMGRFGLYVDRPESGGDPIIRKYYAENIINWDVDEFGRPQMVMLEECVMVPGKDRWEKNYEIQYRELYMDSDGIFRVQLYDKKGKPKAEATTPTNQGQVMDHIPFFMVNPFGVGFSVEKPPMLEIADINISHYRTSADLEHGRHFTALPTPVVSGASSTTELLVGSQAAWILPDPASRASYLEFTGQGLQSLEKALQEKQSQLASMSARLLDTSKRGSEAEGTVRLRYASETASLAMVVRACEALMKMTYMEIAIMQGLDPGQVEITLNKEFLDTRIQGKELVDLVQSFIEGGISEETLVYNLRRGDIIDVNRDDGEEIAAVRAARDKILAANAAKTQTKGVTVK